MFHFVLAYIRGVGAMEIVAMDMKLRGMYIARQLSFQGVTFKIEEVPLTHNYIKMYNKSVRLVCALAYLFVRKLCNVEGHVFVLPVFESLFRFCNVAAFSG